MDPLLRRSYGVFTWLVVAALTTVTGGTARAQQRTATVTGVVRDSLGVAIPGVYVGVVGGGYRVTTDDSGRYRIRGVVAGPATMTARRIGYRPHSRRVWLEGGELRAVDFRLELTTAALAEVRVTEAREVWESRLAGFNARSKQQIGHFVTRERIERANSSALTDMLREIPGVRIGAMLNEGRMIRLRGATCPPLIFVDGFPATAGEFDLDIIDLKSVEGIEVYGGMASIPAELTGPRELDRCGVIAVWSRPARPRIRTAGSLSGAEPPVAREADYFTPDQVDDRAALDSGTLEPRYPDSLYRAKVAGEVVVEFVVDTLGLADPATVDILSSTDDLFSLAVRSGLTDATFTPARRRGRRVRQLMQLPVSFTLGDPRP
jgi:TonB family protein